MKLVLSKLVNVKLFLFVGTLLAVGLVASPSVLGQQYLTSRAVGGVVVDPNGLLTKASADDLAELRQSLGGFGATAPAELATKTSLRKISLSRLNRLLQEANQAGQPVPDEVYCLGGLQDIRYVVADPDQKDIFLIGEAEGWKAGPGGVLVGNTTGRAVMLLDDFVVALRSVSQREPQVISCSINPRGETLPALQQFTRKAPRDMPAQMVAQRIEEILGPQEVTITGVPADSHFARVLIAADYRMKRIGLGLDPSPVADLPPFTVFLRSASAGMMPRWWLVPEAPSLVHDPEALVWEIPGIEVKTLSEMQFVASRQQNAKAAGSVPGADRWAEVMTAKYAQLAQVDPIFDQLQNCMELAVVAAIIVSHRLVERSGAELGALLSEDGVSRARLQPARYVPSQSVIAPAGRGSIVACGGVQINPWAIVQQSQPKEDLKAVRAELGFAGTGWWSN